MEKISSNPHKSGPTGSHIFQFLGQMGNCLCPPEMPCSSTEERSGLLQDSSTVSAAEAGLVGAFQESPEAEFDVRKSSSETAVTAQVTPTNPSPTQENGTVLKGGPRTEAPPQAADPQSHRGAADRPPDCLQPGPEPGRAPAEDTLAGSNGTAKVERCLVEVLVERRPSSASQEVRQACLEITLETGCEKEKYGGAEATVVDASTKLSGDYPSCKELEPPPDSQLPVKIPATCVEISTEPNSHGSPPKPLPLASTSCAVIKEGVLEIASCSVDHVCGAESVIQALTEPSLGPDSSGPLEDLPSPVREPETTGPADASQSEPFNSRACVDVSEELHCPAVHLKKVPSLENLGKDLENQGQGLKDLPSLGNQSQDLKDLTSLENQSQYLKDLTSLKNQSQEFKDLHSLENQSQDLTSLETQSQDFKDLHSLENQNQDFKDLTSLESQSQDFKDLHSLENHSQDLKDPPSLETLVQDMEQEVVLEGDEGEQEEEEKNEDEAVEMMVDDSVSMAMETRTGGEEQGGDYEEDQDDFGDEDLYRGAEELDPTSPKSTQSPLSEVTHTLPCVTGEDNCSLAPAVDLLSYSQREWRGNTAKSALIRKGYQQMCSLFGGVRRVRGDNYCALRAVLFQVLSQSSQPPAWLQQEDVTMLPEELDRQDGLISQWLFPVECQRGDEQRDATQQLTGYIELLQNTWATAAACSSPEERRLRCEAVFQGGEEELGLLEALKLLMLGRAAELHRLLEEGGEVPIFCWLLFARDSSPCPRTLLANHLRHVGFGGGLEQVEMCLLGYALRCTIQVFRLYMTDTQEFLTFYPDDHREDWPSVSLLTEDDRHYNVPVINATQTPAEATR